MALSPTSSRGSSSGSSSSVVTLKYLEWTATGAATKTTVLPAGTQVVAGWFATDTTFDDATTLSLGDNTSPTAFADAFVVTNHGQIWTVGDLYGASFDASNFRIGFPFTNDGLASYPSGTTITGTLAPGASTVGRVRFYFLSAIPALAT